MQQTSLGKLGTELKFQISNFKLQSADCGSNQARPRWRLLPSYLHRVTRLFAKA